MPFQKDFLKKFPGDVLIETGTYLGDGVAGAIEAGYKQIISIELNKNLATNASKRFEDNKNVKIICGRAHEVLPAILLNFRKEKIVFWLDAHYSACGTSGEDDPQPLLKELAAIEEWKNTFEIEFPTIIIDDLRTFSYEQCSFSEKEILDAIAKINFGYVFHKEHGFQEHTGVTFHDDILVASMKI